MRIRVDHVTTYRYEAPARSVIQLLRLIPRSHDGQHVVRWRVESDADVRLKRGEDSLGNVTQTVFIAGPLQELSLTVEGEVETWETHGVVRGAAERFPPEAFLRETPLTEASPDIAAFALDAAAGGGDRIEQLHRLMLALRREMDFDTDPTDAATTASEAFALRRGVCQDFTHVFIAAARRLGAPARYVSGHLSHGGGGAEQEAAHAWAEAHVPELGWVGFDAANGVCPTPAYIRVATGLDYLGAAPVRGSRSGGGREALDVRLNVSHAQLQTQA